jgi:hypothetical protein
LQNRARENLGRAGEKEAGGREEAPRSSFPPPHPPGSCPKTRPEFRPRPAVAHRPHDRAARWRPASNRWSPSAAGLAPLPRRSCSSVIWGSFLALRARKRSASACDARSGVTSTPTRGPRRAGGVRMVGNKGGWVVLPPRDEEREDKEKGRCEAETKKSPRRRRQGDKTLSHRRNAAPPAPVFALRSRRVAAPGPLGAAGCTRPQTGGDANGDSKQIAPSRPLTASFTHARLAPTIGTPPRAPRSRRPFGTGRFSSFSLGLGQQGKK